MQPGRMCPICSTIVSPVDEAYIHVPEQENSPTTVPFAVDRDFIWVRPTPKADFIPIVDQARISRNQCLYVPRHGEAELADWEAKNAQRNGTLQVL